MHAGVVASQQPLGGFFLQLIASSGGWLFPLFGGAAAFVGNEEPVGLGAGEAALELAVVTPVGGAAAVEGNEEPVGLVAGKAALELAVVTLLPVAALEAVAAEVSGRAGVVLGELQAIMSPTRITALGATQPSPRRRALRQIIAEA